MKITTKLWVGLGILIVLSPLGLIIPQRFKAGSAWGEWGVEEVKNLAGYIPKGFQKLSNLWHAPLPDYSLKGWEEKGLPHLSAAYILSAAVGISVTVLLVWLIGKMLVKKGN